jgi:acetolactate synthase-1/2/3 large subunit
MTPKNAAGKVCAAKHLHTDGLTRGFTEGMQMKGSDLFVAALENEGVDRIFGVPGEENLAVVESLRRSSIELVVTRHEQPAAFLAATYGRLTGKPGVALSTLGPGGA